METPSSTRRLTRSQLLATSKSNAINSIPMSRRNGESEKGNSKSRPRTGNQQDRSALIDISNDSPIVGLAIGRLVETPLSEVSKKTNSKQAKDPINTPGSGEALLRGQVKSLLQKVEEEAELSKLSWEHKPFFSHLKGCFVNSPTGLLAPTPANTPLVLNLSDDEGFKNSCLALVTPSPVQEHLMTSQIVAELLEGTEQEGPVCENSSITRSLLLDFTEKLEGSDPSGCSSVLTNIGGENEGKEKSSSMEEDDSSSVWSVQVNASSKDNEEEDEDGVEEVEEDDDDDDDDDYAEEEEGDDGGSVDELCEWMSNISVCEGELITKFRGKHTRFVYNRDDEIEGEEVCVSGESEASFAVSTGIVCLKGLPAPEGKHFRFPEEEEEEDN